MTSTSEMASCKPSIWNPSIRRRLMVGIGVLLVIVGAVLVVYHSSLFQQLLLKELPLTPESSSFHIWRTTPVPMHIDFYFWNWTNPGMIDQQDVKPAFVQMGPYRFMWIDNCEVTSIRNGRHFEIRNGRHFETPPDDCVLPTYWVMGNISGVVGAIRSSSAARKLSLTLETREKVNITWNRNGTVSFRQVRRWWFDPRNSAGSLDDKITTVNVVALTAAHLVRNWSFLYQRTVSAALSSTSQTLAITRTAGELLFEGYSDPLVSIASSVPGLSDIQVPFDRFGWFYKRNGSSIPDGVLNMFSGTDPEEGGGSAESGIAQIGVLDRWNGNAHTPYYGGDCGRVFGSAGELWPPGQHQADNITLFSTDLCRAVRLGATGVTSFESLSGRLFAGGPLLLDNGEDSCFCNGECLANGVLNVTACRYGAPAFVSMPHFFSAHHSFRDAIGGMRPDPENHNLYIILEPTTGIPLDVAARFQINLLLQRSKNINMLNNVPQRILVPVIWFEQRASITPELGASLRLLLRVPLLLRLSAGLVIATGFVLILSPLILPLFSRCCRTLVASAGPDTTSLSDSPRCSEKEGLTCTCPLIHSKPVPEKKPPPPSDAQEPLLEKTAL